MNHPPQKEDPPILQPDPNDPQVLAPLTDGVSGQGKATRVSAAFMLAHPAHLIALGFGSGLSRLAPGTVGTLWAWLAYLIFSPYMSAQALAIMLLLATVVGWWACTLTASHMRVADPSAIVWDEIVAFWLIMWLIMPTGFWGQFAAFVLFRLFDAAKLGPVRWADQHFKGLGWRGGWGIMLDDFVAAFCVLFLIAAWRAI